MRPDGEVGNDEHAEEDESSDAHRPGEAHLRNQLRDHDWENDAAERGARGCYSECSGTVFQKPRWEYVHSGIKDCGGSNGAAHPLREEDLVVLRRQRNHHQSKNMADRAEEEEMARSVGVEYVSEDRPAGKH